MKNPMSAALLASLAGVGNQFEAWSSVGPERTGSTAPQPKQCSWCNRFYNSHGHYVDKPFIVVNLSHGICQSCRETWKAELAITKGEIQ